jgi:O-antigen ligase
VPAAWVAAVALIVRARIQLQRRELVFLGGLVALTMWTALSLVWTRDYPQTMLEIQRLFVYVAVATAAVLVLRRRYVPWAVAGMAAAAFGICAYALATRVFPTVGRETRVAQNRLEGTIGYWNGLGIFAVITVFLLLALLVRSPWRPVRPLAAAAVVIVLPVLYFTYSRGAWAALIVGVPVAFALDPHRLRTSLRVLVVAPFAAVAVIVCARSGALTQLFGSLGEATVEGHRVAVEIVLLAVGAAVATTVFEWASARARPSADLRRAYAVTLLAAVLVAVSLALAHYGGPVSAAKRAYHSFNSPAVQVGVGESLNARLFNLSSNHRLDLWSAAWRDFAAHPVLGSGAGSFETFWYRHRTDTQPVRDAHSLYLETLAELGIPGLVLLVLVLATPLAAVARIRRSAFAPMLAAAYVAFLLHAAVDWDWELSAVTLTALLCGVLLLTLAHDGRGLALRTPARAVFIVLLLVPLAGFSLYSLIGNRKLSSASEALAAGDWNRAAAEARSAADWLPWSSSAWQLLAVADGSRGRQALAVADMWQAVIRSPNQWSVWYDLGTVAEGRVRRAAYAKARQLNPLEGEIPKG